MLGAAFLAVVDDTVMRRTIGVVLVVLVVVHVIQSRRGPQEPVRAGGVAAAVFGLLAGFTTMVANAGGAAMSLYLLSAGLGVLAFLGTGAVNLLR